MASSGKVNFDNVDDGNKQRSKTGDIDEDIFSSISDEINSTIKTFIRQYQSQQQVTIIDYELEKKQLEAARNCFTSVALRLNFSLSTNNRSSVLFKVPQLGLTFQFAEKRLFYEKEKFMYRNILPRIHALWPDGETPPFAKFYTATGSGILVLENLEESGFRKRRKDSLLDFADAKVVLKSIARFHAISTRLLNDDSLSMGLDDVTVADIIQDEDMIGDFFDGLSVALKKHIFPLVGEGVRKAYDDYFANYRSVLQFGNLPNVNGLNVILHGDLNFKNILFRNGDCRFIDFQASRRGSPAIDLVFFLVSSVKLEVVENDREALIDVYMQEFNRLVDGNGQRYDLNMLNADLDKQKRYFLHILSFTATLWTEECKLDYEGEETDLDRVLMSEKYRSTFRYWVKYFKLE